MAALLPEVETSDGWGACTPPGDRNGRAPVVVDASEVDETARVWAAGATGSVTAPEPCARMGQLRPRDFRRSGRGEVDRRRRNRLAATRRAWADSGPAPRSVRPRWARHASFSSSSAWRQPHDSGGAGRATVALATLLRDQPLSPGKVSVAWSAAVGGAVARVTTVVLDSEGGLAVIAADGQWAREFYGSRSLITDRLNRLLGDGVVKRIEIPGANRGTPAFPPLERSSLNWATRGGN